MKKQFPVTAVCKITYLLAIPRTAFAFSCFHSMMLSVMYLSLASVGNRGMSCCSAWCYQGSDKSLARPTSCCILFDGENISFVASLVIYIYVVLIFLQL
jgi:hypothetical protein